MIPQTIQMPSTKAIVSAAASAAASAVLLRSIARDLVPRSLQHYLLLKLGQLLGLFDTQLTLVIEEFDGLNHNDLFWAAATYLGHKLPTSTPRFRVSRPQKETTMKVSTEPNESIADKFNGVSLNWRLVSKQIPSKYITNPGELNTTFISEIRYFELSFHGKHKEMVFDNYLPYVMEKSKAVKEEKKTLKIFTLKFDRMRRHRGDLWQSVILDHPATFDTLAMDSGIKEMVIDDLDKFLRRKELYRKVGKAWKRGYLLFGPPGTGKSSLIAAMANYLKFDIYDLELTDIRSNSELRRLLISTANRSILVVEDIDCSIELQKRLKEIGAIAPYRHSRRNSGTQITLSGLLNFIDGLWSCCGDERIIVFTTNHKDRLDPALLRPGRMDVHIDMSYCTPCGFKLLAANYLGITEHSLFSVVEHLVETVKVTPAEVGEQLMKNEEPEIALGGLIEFLQVKKERDETMGNEEKPEASAARKQELEVIKTETEKQQVEKNQENA